MDVQERVSKLEMQRVEAVIAKTDSGQCPACRMRFKHDGQLHIALLVLCPMFEVYQCKVVDVL